MKKIFIVIPILLLVVVSTNVTVAGSSDGGKIKHIASVENVLLFAISGGTENDRPACATTRRFAVTQNSIHVPVIISAFETARKLRNVRGFGTCNLWRNSEDLQWIEVGQIPAID